MKIIASDFDGTIVRDGVHTMEDVEAINKWREAGNLFVIVTGRNLTTALAGIRKHKIPHDFLLCCTGSIIADEYDRVIRCEHIDGSFLTEMADIVKKMGGLYMSISCAEKLYIVDIGKQYPDPQIDVSQLAKIKDFSQCNVCFETEEESKLCCDYLNEHFSDKVWAHLSGLWADICGPGFGKSNGIYNLLELTGGKKDEVFTVGDNFNDYDMLKEFNGYVVSDGKVELREITKGVVDNIAELVSKLL